MGGLEPPTSSLSETRSNQLSYTPVDNIYCIYGITTQNQDFFRHNEKLCQEAELNCRHEDFQSSALPTELSWRYMQHQSHYTVYNGY